MTDVVKAMDVAELEKLGFDTEAILVIEPQRGRYVVTLLRVIEGVGTESREFCWEPAEPEAQRIAVKWALEYPEEAVLLAARADIAKRRDEAALPPL